MVKKQILGLEGMRFYAYHGVYEHEQTHGGEYLVDVYLSIHADEAAKSDDLKDTVNYEDVYAVVKEVMDEKCKLIETITFRIVENLKLITADGTSVKVRVKKLRPPLEGEVYASVFELET